MKSYAFHPAAVLDLEEIWDFIGLDSPDRADDLVGEILTRISALCAFPHQGHRRLDLSSRDLRFIVVRDYLIAYAPEETPMWVIAVVHGRRNPRLIAALLRDRDI